MLEPCIIQLLKHWKISLTRITERDGITKSIVMIKCLTCWALKYLTFKNKLFTVKADAILVTHWGCHFRNKFKIENVWIRILYASNLVNLTQLAQKLIPFHIIELISFCKQTSINKFTFQMSFKINSIGESVFKVFMFLYCVFFINLMNFLNLSF